MCVKRANSRNFAQNKNQSKTPMKKFILAIMSIIIGLVAFASSSSVPQMLNKQEATKIVLRHNKVSSSNQKRMPSYTQDDEILCWYDGESIYVDFVNLDITSTDSCILKITSNESFNEIMVSSEEMTMGITIGMYDTFDVEIIIPEIGIYQGGY